MKALVLKDYKRFSYEDVPLPKPGPEEVLVSVKACGICGSDVHGMDGSTGRRKPPIIMGHEAAGSIAALGAAVRGWTIVPAASWPMMIGGWRRPVLPSMPCTSLPQIPQAATRTSTSSGPISGTGQSCSSRQLYRVSTRACIVYSSGMQSF